MYKIELIGSAIGLVLWLALLVYILGFTGKGKG